MASFYQDYSFAPQDMQQVPPPQQQYGGVVGGDLGQPTSFAVAAQQPDEQAGLGIGEDGAVGVPGEASVYVGNLSWGVTWQSLKDHFKSAGNVVRANVTIGSDGRSQGWGLVTFSSPLEAQNAITMLNDSHLDGRMVFVREDRGTRSTLGGGGGGHGGGGGYM
jgi:hypothetical protein